MSRLKRALKRDAEAFIPKRANTEKRPKPVFRRTVACLCSLVLFATAAAVTFGHFFGQNDNKPNYANCYFSIDINPSLEFITGEDGRVEKISPKNRSATALIDNARAIESAALVGSDAESVLVTILGAAESSGYFDRTAKNNAVLINVLCEDGKTQQQISEVMKTKTVGFFKQEYIYGVVLTSTSKASNAETAASLEITPAKLDLIDEIIRFDRTGTYSRETLAVLPVKDLNTTLISLKNGYIVFDDPEFDEAYDAFEAFEDAAEELTDRVEELFENFEEEQDDEEEEEDKAAPRGTLPDAISSANALISAFNAQYDAELAPLPQMVRPDKAVDSLKKEVEEALKRGKAEIDKRVSAYNSQIHLESARIKEATLSLWQEIDQTSHIKKYRKDYEKWREQAEEEWEDRWEDLQKEWEIQKGISD